MARLGLSAKFGVLVFKASLLWYLGRGPLTKVGLSAKILCSGIQGISALVHGGSIGQSRVICQLLCSGMQVISALVLGGPLARVGLSAKFCVVVIQGISALVLGAGGSIGQSKVICQLLCSGMQVISALVLGGPLARVGLSAKFWCTCI